MPATDQQLAQCALQFLIRVNLSGSEVPAYQQVQNYLVRLSQPPIEDKE